ncbi:MAG: hypothetical protein QM680_05980 [Luteolibacter sp.]
MSKAINDPRWLVEARNRFGDKPEVFDEVFSPYMVWAKLTDVFRSAYQYPYKEADIRAIYDYAGWCCRQPRGETAKDDLLTVVAVSFYEHIPEIDAAVRDLPRWFKFEEVMQMQDVLSYRVGPAGFEKIVSVYPKSQRNKYRPRR